MVDDLKRGLEKENKMFYARYHQKRSKRFFNCFLHVLFCVVISFAVVRYATLVVIEEFPELKKSFKNSMTMGKKAV